MNGSLAISSETVDLWVLIEGGEMLVSREILVVDWSLKALVDAEHVLERENGLVFIGIGVLEHI